jgi:bifunctional UDP-N-acetylglucosamine pyrophosphorylase/glucosamine-1-phosphate N-acetyltransferase
MIGDAVFIGSNSSLVAPVTVGNGATVGAGSVITRDVAENAAFERAQQIEKANYQRPQKTEEIKGKLCVVLLVALQNEISARF